MAQPTSQLTRFVGPIFSGAAPPTVAELGKPLEEGMMYIDTEPTNRSVCFYNATSAEWDCVSLSAATPTTTSTSTSTSTSTTTSAT